MLVADCVTLARTTTHDFDGRWQVTETIDGTYEGGRPHAAARYEECGDSQPACPGRCTTTADLLARP